MVKRSGILFPAIVSSTLTIPIMFSESFRDLHYFT